MVRGMHWKGETTSLKLTEQVMKFLERIVDGLVRQLVSIDDFQYGLVPGRGTTDAIFGHGQAAAREVSSCQQETLHGFCRPWEGVWLCLGRSPGGPEKTWCLSGLATGARDVCQSAPPCPCWWGVQWWVWSEGRCSPRLGTQSATLHQCAWSLVTQIPLWGPLEDLYADDLVIIAESLEECIRRLLTWKEATEEKGLRINAGKTKIMTCGTGLDLLQS